MAEELKKYLFLLLKQVDGLHAIIITDRDGVPVLKVNTENAPEKAMKPGFLQTFGMMSEQASKLGLSKNKHVIASYTTCQVVQLNKSPLMVTLIASSSANTGLLLSLDGEMTDILKDLRQVVDVQ